MDARKVADNVKGPLIVEQAAGLLGALRDWHKRGRLRYDLGRRLDLIALASLRRRTVH
jgi:hypothetical protein